MFNQIIKYINTYPVIFALIVLLLLLIIYRLYTCTHSEKFTNSNQSIQVNTILGNTVPISQGGVNNIGVTNPALPQLHEAIKDEMPKIDLNQYLLGDKYKLVRFRATINGKNYYLMISPISQCSNLYTPPNMVHPNPVKNPKDCSTNVVILIDENTAMLYLNDYLNQISDKEKVCNFQQTLSNRRATQTIQSSQLFNISNANDLMPGQTTPHLTTEMCPEMEQYPGCRLIKQSPIDFIVTLTNPFSVSETEDQQNQQQPIRYFIQGVSGPLNIDTSNIRYFLNQNFNNDPSVVNTLCADAVSRTDPKIVVDLVTTKQTNDHNNIIGYDSGLRTRIRFNIIVRPLRLDPITNRAITQSFYLGVCRNNICTFNGANYARACLFKNMLDPNVLEFEPIIVQYN